MKLSKKISAINALVYKSNKFTFYEHDLGDWFPVYVDLDRFRKSETIYPVFFSHVYCELLYDWCNALGLSYLFTLSEKKYGSDNEIFLSEKTRKVKNKNLNIRLSAYLQHIVKTFEDNQLDVFCPNSVHSIFDYDDISVIEIVRNVMLEFLIKSSDVGVSENLEIFKKNTKRILKLLKKRSEIEKGSRVELIEKENIASEKNDEFLTIEQTAIILKVKRQTVYNWKKKGLIQAHSIGGKVYYKKSELLKVPIKLK
ncbi:hypothetical protein LPB136_13465 [Tenacibaculum todarodis]|uniref:Helix-turn-helix domain-containing protein n=1 Tax=Tenacibaculum todarodis TaxID=1850252 RepID=A0A1L3JMK8_9FLAO|nr:helix-turn-helix domain-containing protein [Tenacibaculum todarodis]APG66319.1 hypothetical protein LPB136_13465 [Tenacibaculum todarodis]